MTRLNPFAQTETQLVASCLQWLRLHKARAWRQNSGQLNVKDETRKGGVRRIRFAGAAGISDIIGVLPCGCFLAAEAKIKKRPLTDDQRRFLEDIAKCGGVALEVRDEVGSLIRAVEAHEVGCRKKRERVA